MNALVKKEIRSILPGWIAILLLETVIPWFSSEPDAVFAVLPFFFFFGIVILAIDSFGREFSYGTFQLLLSQPVERRQIWRTKMTVLFSAIASIFMIYFASCWLRLHVSFVNAQLTGDRFNMATLPGIFWYSIFQSVIAALIAVTGALWTTLLLRQIATAFWITFLTPAGLAMAIIFFLSEKISDFGLGIIFFAASILYSVFGFWLARKLFYRAQDAAWTGGVINFSRWRYFESGGESSAARFRRPIRALFRKEFQLHSIALIGGGVLLGLQVVVFFLRAFYANTHKNSMIAVISDFFWVLWLVMPLVIGCMAVAEERKLGVADEQFCLPVSRRLQFLIKFIPTMFFGILLGGVMPLLLERIAAHFGAPNEIFSRETHPDNGYVGIGLLWFLIDVVALSAGFALAAFFGSTLAKNFLQALSIAILTMVGCWALLAFFIFVNAKNITFFGITPWHSFLPVLVALLVVPTALIWLAYLNFNHFQESKRLWRRNVLGISGALLFVIVSSTLIYNRAWEIFEPAEPPHGAAKLSLRNPPKIMRSDENLLVQLPDGRVWFDSLGWANFITKQRSQWEEFFWMLNPPLPTSDGPEQFVGGSNWVSVTANRVDFGDASDNWERVYGYSDTVGVKADGTLWISSKAEPKVWTGADMIQFGTETNWLQATRRFGRDVLLLKSDGTLWRWIGITNADEWLNWQTHWPTVRNRMPERIGTDSDWKEISTQFPFYCRKKDGSVWEIGENHWQLSFERKTNLDQIVFPISFGNNQLAYVKDGALKIFGYSNSKWKETAVNNETNWHTAILRGHDLIALKSDGTLWRWQTIYSPRNAEEIYIRDFSKIPPTRIGIHNDWVAIGDCLGGFVSLAADGSLWFWPMAWDYDYNGYRVTLIKPPKQPEFLGNVFSNEK